MRINGEWALCDDDAVRPILRGELQTADGRWVQAPLLVDTGADCTVLSADVFDALKLPAAEVQSQLGGIGGAAESVIVHTQLPLLCDDGRAAFFKGNFAAFTSPSAADMSVLGRDILASFAVIIDQPGDVVCLIGQRHRYLVQFD
jgi:hypothetical protein